MKRAVAVAILLIVALVLAAVLLARRAGFMPLLVVGGAATARSRAAARAPARSQADIVVDTLNLTHWRKGGGRSTIVPADIFDTIAATAPLLREKYAGKVMYVVKDRESVLNEPATRQAYRELAARHSVNIYVVERYEDPPRHAAVAAGHAARGRDDFYMALLAWRNHCDVMSNDRFRDFGDFRFGLDPFHVYEFAFWRELPEREYVRPDAEKAGRPRGVPYLPAMKNARPPVATANTDTLAATANTDTVNTAKKEAKPRKKSPKASG